MNARGRLCIAATSAVIAVAVLPLPAVARSANRRAQDADSIPALTQTAKCVIAQQSLDVLMLIDQSGSLVSSDAQNLRVTAAKAALVSLAGLAEAKSPSGGRTSVQVQLAGFSADFIPGHWIDLTRASLGGAISEADGFASQNQGLDTDFFHAFDGAQQELARHAANATRAPCQMLVLFTDGDYDIDPRVTDAQRSKYGTSKDYAASIVLDSDVATRQVIKIGKRLMCDPNGTADELHRDGVVDLTVALSGGISPDDQKFLQSVAQGSTGGQPCDRLGTPSTGAFLPTTDVSKLPALFDRIANELQQGTRDHHSGPLPICESPKCVGKTFTIDPGLGRFHLLATSSVPFRIRLQSPAPGLPFEAGFPQSTHGSLGTAELQTTWLSSTAVAIDVTLPSRTQDWVGKWAVFLFAANGKPIEKLGDVQIYLFGDLAPQLIGVPILHLGETGTIEAGIVDVVGTPKVPKGFVQAATIDGEVTTPVANGQTFHLAFRPNAEGTYRADLAVPSKLASLRLYLELRLTVITKSGVRLAPSRAGPFPLDILLPPTYPTITPLDLHPDPITGMGSTHVTLTITGGRRSGGCVVFSTPTFESLPHGVRRITSTLDPEAGTPSHCLQVDKGASRTVELTLTPSAEGNGAVEGSMLVALKSNEDAHQYETPLTIEFRMSIPVNAAKRAELFFVILLLGILLPVAVLYGVNILLSKFRRADELRVAVVPAIVDANGVLRLADGAAPHVDPPPMNRPPQRGQPVVSRGGSFVLPPMRDWDNFAGPPKPWRSTTWQEFEFRSRIPRTPFGAPYGVVRHTTDPLVTSEDSGGSRASGRLPLALNGAWLFRLRSLESDDQKTDPDRAEGTEEAGAKAVGVLHAFIDEGSDTPADLRAFSDRLERDVAAHIRLLVADPNIRAMLQPAGFSRADEDGGGERSTSAHSSAASRSGNRPRVKWSDPSTSDEAEQDSTPEASKRRGFRRKKEGSARETPDEGDTPQRPRADY